MTCPFLFSFAPTGWQTEYSVFEVVWKKEGREEEGREGWREEWREGEREGGGRDDELRVAKRGWGCLWMEGDRLTEWLPGGIPSNSLQFRVAGNSLSMNKL